MRRLPTGAFLAAVSVVCLALAVSAGYSYITLSRLRAEYLLNRGHEIASAIEMETRGPGRRNNPLIWQELFDEFAQNYQDSIQFIALTDASRRILASRGGPPDAISTSEAGFSSFGGVEIFVLDLPLMQGRQGMGPIMHQPAGWRLRLGLKTSTADFIRRQAVAQIVIAAAAISTLAALAYFALHTLGRFLRLKAREESERHLRALGTMAATLAHEIRNPLGAMKGLTQLAQEDLSDDHRAQESLKTIVREAERLEKLVADLLMFARPPQPHLSRFDLLDLVSSVGNMLQPKFDSAGITFRIASGEKSLVIESDETGMRQVLLNIFLNAMEAAPPGSAVAVQVARKDGTRELTLEVDDSGDGLGIRDPEELFQPFATSKIQGTGLGLAISRQIMEKLGGTLKLENRPQGGARCSLRLPNCVVDSGVRS
ncbi:MAG TPA: ATP-binding protein [Acidobacteriota bacterium]|nr:ATP-binding protein [Acidobacteriota bacterium]